MSAGSTQPDAVGADTDREAQHHPGELDEREEESRLHERDAPFVGQRRDGGWQLADVQRQGDAGREDDDGWRRRTPPTTESVSRTSRRRQVTGQRWTAAKRAAAAATAASRHRLTSSVVNVRSAARKARRNASDFLPSPTWSPR